MSASVALKTINFEGRSVRAKIDVVTIPNVGERIVLNFISPGIEILPVVLMPDDARALAKALEMFA